VNSRIAAAISADRLTHYTSHLLFWGVGQVPGPASRNTPTTRLDGPSVPPGSRLTTNSLPDHWPLLTTNLPVGRVFSKLTPSSFEGGILAWNLAPLGGRKIVWGSTPVSLGKRADLGLEGGGAGDGLGWKLSPPPSA
jgi:hypothetical protein